MAYKPAKNNVWLLYFILIIVGTLGAAKAHTNLVRIIKIANTNAVLRDYNKIHIEDKNSIMQQLWGDWEKKNR